MRGSASNSSQALRRSNQKNSRLRKSPFDRVENHARDRDVGSQSDAGKDKDDFAIRRR